MFAISISESAPRYRTTKELAGQSLNQFVGRSVIRRRYMVRSTSEREPRN